MPPDIILQTFKSLHTFVEIYALVRTSRRFYQVWSQNVSSITNTLIPSITYKELAEDLLVVQNLASPASPFTYQTLEMNYLEGVHRFMIRQQEAIKAHCDSVDGTPVQDLVTDIDETKENIENLMTWLSPLTLAQEKTMIFNGVKTMADICLLDHVHRLLAVDKLMRAKCEIFRREMMDCFGRSLHQHPKDLTDKETDRFMKAAYRVAILTTSKYMPDESIVQAVKGALLLRLDYNEKWRLNKVNDWLLFVRYSNPDSRVTRLVERKKLFFKPTQNEKWKSSMKAGSSLDPVYFNTKDLILSIAEGEWTVGMHGQDREDDEDVDSEEDYEWADEWDDDEDEDEDDEDMNDDEDDGTADAMDLDNGN